jgi:Na+-driven multidrug efflux pump
MMMIFPMSITVSNRVFYSLISNKISEAKYVATFSVIQTILYGMSLGLVYYFFWDNLGALFTGNEDIIKRIQSIMLYGTIYLLVFSSTVCFDGILRGLGYQLELLRYAYLRRFFIISLFPFFSLSFLCVWLLGGGLSIYFAFIASPTYGLEGIWTGTIIGVSFQSVIQMLLIFCTDWKKESRRIKFVSRLVEEKIANTSYGELILPFVGSRSVGGFLISIKAVEDELLELEAIELE